MDDEFVLTESIPQEAIPEGEILGAEVVSAEVRETPFDDRFNPGQKQKKVNFRFIVTEEGPWQGRTVFGDTPTTFTTHPDCKLRVWVQEILGQDELEVDFRFKPEALDGMPVRVCIGARKKQHADGTTGFKNFVSDVIRASTVKTASDLF